jgi:transketolase
MRKQFIKTLQNILYKDIDTVLLLGDIGVFGFREEFKNISSRVYNIGILEQSMISVSAGLSLSGFIPFVHTIAPFLVERAFEQLKIDFGYQELYGNFITVGNSYDYSSLGCTHHCPGDIQLISSIPNFRIYAPGTSLEFDTLLSSQYNNKQANYWRLSESENKKSIEVISGKANVIKKGNLATIVVYSTMLDRVVEACDDLDVTILYYTTIVPFDSETLLQNLNSKIIVCEPFYESSTNMLINKKLTNHNCSILNIGVPRHFLNNYGSKQDQDTFLKLDQQNIRDRITECLR